MSLKAYGAALCMALGLATASNAMADTLVVGTESAYAPFEFKQGDKLVGFDIDLVEAVANQMGDDVKWTELAFDGLIPAVLSNQVDVAAASFTITAERAKRVNFSDPYYRSGLTFVVRTADKDKYKTIDSLKGLKLCAKLGTVSADKANEFSPGKVTTFADSSTAYLELKGGGCEAVLNDRPVNLYFMQTANSDGSISEIADVMDAENMGFVLNKNNTELLEKFNAALKTVKENGEYQKIFEKWFGKNAADSAVN